MRTVHIHLADLPTLHPDPERRARLQSLAVDPNHPEYLVFDGDDPKFQSFVEEQATAEARRRGEIRGGKNSNVFSPPNSAISAQEYRGPGCGIAERIAKPRLIRADLDFSTLISLKGGRRYPRNNILL